MSQQAYPTLNDVEPSWADIQTTFTVSGGDLIDMADIAAVKWSRKVEVGTKYGANGGRPMARTTGQASFEASVTLYRSGFLKLLRGLKAKGTTRGNQVVIGTVGFDLLIQHTPPGSTEIFTTKVKGCRYLGDSDDMKEGTEADKLEITLNPIEVCNIVDGVEIAIL